jgi:hypothetical protein
MYIIKKGRCVVRRDVEITKMNRWPKSKGEWEVMLLYLCGCPFSIYNRYVCMTFLPLQVSEKKFIKTITMSHLASGDYFGENGVITGKKRFASVVAESVVQILELSKKDFALLAYGQTLDIFKETISSYKGIDHVKRMVAKHENDTGEKSKKGNRQNNAEEAQRMKISSTIKSIIEEIPGKEFSQHFDIDAGIMRRKRELRIKLD